LANHALDIALEAGSPDLPACVLIHGVGMSKAMWADPAEARVMGGLFPIRVMLTEYDRLRTLYHDLSEEGFTVLTWSQHRPVGPAAEAVAELKRAMEVLGKIPHKGLIIIGHSRGGLLARAALASEEFPPGGEDLLGLVTLCTPHGGSELSRWAVHAGKLTSVLNSKIDDPGGKHSVRGTIKNMMEFVESKGVKELLPGSEFLGSLPVTAPEGAYCLSVGGTNPALITMPGGFSFPSTFEKIFPDGLYPEEMAEGKGDGLVTATSARLPYASEHLDFHVNHAAVVVDSKIRSAVVERIKKHCLL